MEIFESLPFVEYAEGVNSYRGIYSIIGIGEVRVKYIAKLDMEHEYF